MSLDLENAVPDTIDPFVLKRASDWGDLVGNKILMQDTFLVTVDPQVTNQVLVPPVDSALPKSSIPKVTALWFSAAVLGTHLRFPINTTQLFCYQLHNSFYWASMITFLCFLELLSPFIEVSGCDYTGNLHGSSGNVNGANPMSTTAICFVCVCVQLLDVVMYFRSCPIENVKHDGTRLVADHTHAWMGVYGICTVICIVDFLAYFGCHGNSPRLARVLFPIILISRQENARLIIEGFFRVLQQTLFIIGLLLTIINFMALMGLFLFKDMSRTVGVFDYLSFKHAFMTCLHCFASRPTVLFTVNPFVAKSNAPPYFYIALTLFADLLVGTLIVAVANRYYRDFKTLSFRKRLLYRRNALLSILTLLNIQDYKIYQEKKLLNGQENDLWEDDPVKLQGLSLQQWLLFCSYIDAPLNQPSEVALKIFACCCSCMDNCRQGILRGEIDVYDDSLIDKRCTSVEFFQMCAWLASKVQFRSVDAVQKRKSILLAMKERNDHVVEEREIKIDNSTSNVGSSEHSSNLSHTTVAGLKSSVELVKMGAKGIASTSGSEGDDNIAMSPNPMHSSSNINKLLSSAGIAADASQNKIRKKPGYVKRIYLHLIVESGILETITAFSIAVCYPRLHVGSFSMKYITLFNACMHILLIIQLGFVATSKPSVPWLILGWPLLMAFFFDNFVKYFSSTHSKATTLKDLTINVGALIAKSFVGVSGEVNSAAYVAVVLIQSLRSLKLFALIPGAATVIAILPTVMRVFQLLFLVIFMFTIIAHEFFCSKLEVAAVSGADDDSGAWAKFSVILNFSSYLQSFYTLLMISLLSNWSMVMDAVRKTTSPLVAYSFFYCYRLTMVLTCLPLLTSFIIQAFVSQLNLKRVEKVLKKADMVVSNKLFSTGMMKLWSTNNRETVSGAPNAFRQLVMTMNREVMQGTKTIKAKLETSIAGFIQFSKENIPFLLSKTPTKRNKHDTIPLFQIDNVNILYEKEQWEQLANDLTPTEDEDEGGDDAHVASIVTLNIPDDYRPTLANIWFHDAIDGRRLELPSNIRQLIAYQLVRSYGLRLLITATAVIQILLTMILPAICSNSYISSPAAKISIAHQQELEIAIFNLIAGIMYMFDTSLEFWIKYSTKSLKSLLFSWTNFRFICSIIIILSQLSYLGGETRARYALALYPFFIITREVDLRQMLHGLAVSIYGSRVVYNLLFTLLLVWTFLGYYLFHRFTTHAHRFATIRRAFQTCLHCFTSGPYSLFALKPYFSICQAAALFFVMLTLTTEVIGNALIIAVGNVEYKNFVDKNIKRRINCRKNCVLAMWKLFQYSHKLSRKSWLRLCTAFRGKYTISSGQANALFTFVVGREKDASCDVKQFFGLVGMIGACTRVEEVEFVDLAEPITQDTNTEHTSVASTPSQTNLQNRRSSLITLGKLPRQVNLNAVGMGVSSDNGDSFDANLTFMENVHRFSKGHGPETQQLHLYIEPRLPSFITPIALYLCPEIATEIYAGCTMIVNYRIQIGLELGVFEFVTALMHVILLVQLYYLSSSLTITLAWLRFGYFLEFFFWAEMIVRMIAIGGMEFLTIPQNRNHFLINVGSLVCMIAQGNRLDTTTMAMTMLIIIQCLRFLRILAGLAGVADAMLIEIRSTISNVFLIQWCIIYFFAVIAQLQYCGSLNPTVINTNSTDDDAANWPRFANLLNFTTMYYSLFTMFEISVLGNWAMVPDAIVKSNSQQSQTAVYFFFYVYRLMMTLVIYPLLMSFVIRSFIALRDSLSIEKELQLEQRKQQELLALSSKDVDLQSAHTSKKLESAEIDNIGMLQSISSIFNSNLPSIEEDEAEDTNASCYTRLFTRLANRIRRMKLFVTPNTLTAVAKTQGNSFIDLWSFNEKRVIEKNDLYSNMVLLRANSAEEDKYINEIKNIIELDIAHGKTVARTANTM